MDAYAKFVFELNRSEPAAHAVVILYNVYRGPVPGTPYLHGTHDADGVPNRKFADARLPVFFKYTLKSLANQSNDNFFVVFMYEGRTRFSHATPAAIRKRGESEIHVPFEVAPISPIDFTRDYARAFWARRRSVEAAIRKHCGQKRDLLITYLDGDDLLHTDYVARIQSGLRPGIQCFGVPSGFMYSSNTHRLRPWDRPAPNMPPFFTLHYRTAEFLAGKRYYGGPGRHLFVTRHLRSELVPERLFAQHVHGRNDSTAYSMPIGHPDLRGHARKQILRALALR